MTILDCYSIFVVILCVIFLFWGYRDWKREKNKKEIEPVQPVKKETLHYEFLAGTMVISRSNEYEYPTEIVMVVRYESVGQMGSFLPIIRKLPSGEESMACTILVPYSKQLWEFLEKMTNEEQYKYLSEIKQNYRK